MLTTPRAGRSLCSTLIAAAVLASSCGGSAGWSGDAGAAPDSLPLFIGDSLPLRYPPGLYMQQVQGDVVLRLFVDEFGRPVGDSTRVETPSAYADFDSSAVAGARDLVFRPAFQRGKAIAYPVLFPIKFRVPGGPPMPSDTTASAR